MMSTPAHKAHRGLAWFAFVAAVVLAGCGTPQATSLDEFRAAVRRGRDACHRRLVAQTQKLPGFLAAVESKLAKRSVVLDPMIESGTGEQTQATKCSSAR